MIYVAVEFDSYYKRTSSVKIVSSLYPAMSVVKAETIDGVVSSQDYNQRLLNHLTQIREKFVNATLVLDVEQNTGFQGRDVELLISRNFRNVVNFRDVETLLSSLWRTMRFATPVVNMSSGCVNLN